MANVLQKHKQIAVVAALAEGSSIRAIERMTGVNRNTIMSLGVRVGQGCARLMDQKMRGLDCKRLELDEIWGYRRVLHVALLRNITPNVSTANRASSRVRKFGSWERLTRKTFLQATLNG